jgi:hypothetical protein
MKMMAKAVAAIALLTISSGAAGENAQLRYVRCTPDNTEAYFNILSYIWRLGPNEMSYWNPNAGYWTAMCSERRDYVNSECSMTTDYYRFEGMRRGDEQQRTLTISRRTGRIEYATPDRTEYGTCEPTSPPAQMPVRF